MYDDRFHRPGVERSREMRTTNAGLGLLTGASFRGVLAAVVLLGAASAAQAQIAPPPEVMASDETAGYLVFPKIIAEDSAGSGTIGIDTLIQITNTRRLGSGAAPVTLHCWYINANSRCDGTGAVCEFNSDCPGTICVPGWRPNNFEFTLTNEHPIGWSVRDGRMLPITNDDTFAEGTIPAILELPFRGELKCLATDGPDGPPLARNDLKGEATIISVQAPPDGGTPPRMTAASYNAIGFQVDTEAVEDELVGSTDVEDPLCLGGLPPGAADGVECAMTYAPCPNLLIVNHFFDRAQPPTGGFVRTELTLVPCSQDVGQTFPDFRIVSPPIVTAQMLIYNEFEQRFSTSARVQCFRNTTLSDIDTRLGPEDDMFSIFSDGVQGTVAGQTRVRGVTGAANGLGYGLIGVAQEFYSQDPGGVADASAAFNLHADVGFREEFDAVYGINAFASPSPP
jgi:hypothetical protein